MNAAQQFQAALSRLYGPSDDEIREIVRTAAYVLGDGAADLRSSSGIDSALATVEGIRRHLLLLRMQNIAARCVQ